MPDPSKRSSFSVSIKNRFVSVWAKLHGEDSSGNDTKFQTETAGELKAVTYGKDTSSNLLPIRVEATTAEQDIVVHGKDSGGNIDPLRTNANQELIVEVKRESADFLIISPQVLPNAEDILYTVPGANTLKYKIWFYLCEQAGTAQSVTIGLDDAGGGALGAGEYWLYQTTLASNSIMDWVGPFLVKGTDVIRGFDNGGGGADVSLQLRVELL